MRKGNILHKAFLALKENTKQ
jgi:hypothetical protein